MSGNCVCACERQGEREREEKRDKRERETGGRGRKEKKAEGKRNIAHCSGPPLPTPYHILSIYIYKKQLLGIPWQCSGWEPVPSLLKPQLLSLFRELRSYKSCSMGKKKKKAIYKTYIKPKDESPSI